MKPILCIFFVLLVSVKTSFAQCSNPFYAYKNGTTMTMENYDGKDKLTGSQEMQVINWEETSNGYIATMAYKIFDKKGKEQASGEYTMECKDDVIHIDMSSMIPSESMKMFEDMEVEVVMDQLEFPADLEVGDRLDDASILMETKGSPMAIKYTMDIVDRKVEGKETIETPAGTFDCYKLSQSMKSKIMISKTSFKSISYLVEKYGAVKTETYKDNGKLIGYSLLTKFEE